MLATEEVREKFTDMKRSGNFVYLVKEAGVATAITWTVLFTVLILAGVDAVREVAYNYLMILVLMGLIWWAWECLFRELPQAFRQSWKNPDSLYYRVMGLVVILCLGGLVAVIARDSGSPPVPATTSNLRAVAIMWALFTVIFVIRVRSELALAQKPVELQES